MAKILLVEDDPTVREAAASHLRGEGYEVGEAGNGQEALAYLERESKPDLIVMDLVMPVMDGNQFLQELLHRKWFHPVLILTAWLGKLKEEFHYLPVVEKPVGMEELARTIRETLGGKA